MKRTSSSPSSVGHPTLTRRQFLHRTAAGAGVAPLLVTSARAAAESGSGAGAGPRIKLGVIGCGGRGGWIAQLFKKHSGYDMWAVADYFQPVADAAGDALGVDRARRFSGLRGYQRLIESGVEAVALETPPWFFPEHARAAVAAGLHVYMAKPVATDVAGCLEIEAAAQKATAAKRVFLVDYQMPTDPHNLEVLRLIRAGEIGAVEMLDSHYYAGLFADPPKTATIESRLQQLIWVNDIDLGGSYHVNACIHAVDAALWVAGRRPVAAMGLSRTGRADPHGDSPDVYAVVFEFDDGLIWNHRGKHLNNQTGFDVACQVQGRTGHAQVGYGGKAFLRGPENAYNGEIENLYEAGAVRNIARFHDAVTRGDAANETVRRAVDGALVTILARESARRRARLTLDELLREKQRFEVDLRGLKG